MLESALKSRLLAAVAIAPLAAVSVNAAPSPLIDTGTTSPVTSVSREDLEKLPVGRRVEDLIRTCPSTTIPTISRPPQTLIDGKPFSPPPSLDCVQPADLDMIEVYKAHNIGRAEYGAPPLVWDPVLVRSSGAVAEERARTGTRGHSSREGRGTVRENISEGLPWWSTRQLLASWEKEKKNFVPGIFPNVSRTHNWYDIGHWAQMIWIQTVLIGCTKAVGGASAWLVCHYNPGGNKDGKPVGIPVQPQQVASAPDRSIQPRLIGGDYTGKAPSADDTGDALADALSSTYEYGYDMPLVLGYDRGELSIGVYADFQARVDYLMLGDDIFLDLPAAEIPVGQWQPSFGVGPVKTGLDVNVTSGSSGGLGNDVNLDASTDALIDELISSGGIYWDPVAQVTIALGGSFVDIPQADPEVDTKVEQPDLTGKAEVYNPNAQQFDNLLNSFRAGQDHYVDARQRGDVAGMMAGRAEMDAALVRLQALTYPNSILTEGELGMQSAIVESLAIDRQLLDSSTKVGTAKPKPPISTGYLKSAVKLTKAQKQFYDAQRQCDLDGMKKAQRDMETAAALVDKTKVTLAPLEKEWHSKQIVKLVKMGFGSCATYTDTKVEPPDLTGKPEVFKPEPPTKLDDPL